MYEGRLIRMKKIKKECRREQALETEKIEESKGN